MPTLHIIAIGPSASGKSALVRHLANNPPKGWKLTKEQAEIPISYGQEYWALTFEKVKARRSRHAST